MNKRLILGMLALLVVLAGGGASYLLFLRPMPTSVRAIGANVTVADSDMSKGMTAKVANGVTTPFKLPAVGPMVNITPSGHIAGKSVMLAFKLTQYIGTNQQVLLATSESVHGPWTLERPVLSKDGWYASITTNHLSWWQPIVEDLGEMLQELKKNFGSFSGDLFTTAEKPECIGETEARQDGYELTYTAKKALYWCFGVENGKRVLKVVNRMRYPLEVIHPGFTALFTKLNLDLDQLAQLTAGKNTILYPFEEMDFSVDLAPGKKALLSTIFSGLAQSLYTLEIGAREALDVLTAAGAITTAAGTATTEEAKFQQTLNMMSKLVDVHDCANVIFQLDVGKLAASCLGRDNLMKVFQWKSLLVIPIMTGGPYLEWLVSEVQSVIDNVRGTDVYQILIQRSNTGAIFATYVGTWHVHGYILEVRPDYIGTSSENVGPCSMGISLDNVQLCTEYASISFMVKADGSLLGTIQNVWYEYSPTNGGTATWTGALPPGAIEHTGYTFTLMHNGTHYLTQTHPQFATNNALCDSQTSGGVCGA